MPPTTSASRQQTIIQNITGIDFETLKPEDRECAICQQPLKPIYTFNNAKCPEPTVKLVACGHTFGVRCIYRWLAQHGNCPLCREALRPAVDQAAAGMIGLSISGDGENGNDEAATTTGAEERAASGTG